MESPQDKDVGHSLALSGSYSAPAAPPESVALSVDSSLDGSPASC
jgi:hypothetical protein